MNEYNEIEAWLVIAIIIAVLALGFIEPMFEQDAFNRLCHQDATYIEALTSELRIDGSCGK